MDRVRGRRLAGYNDYIFVKNGSIGWNTYLFPDIDMIITSQPSDDWKNSPNLAGFTLPVDDVIVDCEYYYEHAVSTPIVTQVGAGTVTARIFNESDGGGAEIQNTNANIISFAGVNSNGGAAASYGDFVELYSKDMTTNIGSRLFVSSAEIAFYADTTNGALAVPDVSISGGGVLTVGSITLGGENASTWTEAVDLGSQTVTHRTNIVGFAPDQIGTFCESTGELADVYDRGGVPYVPTLDRACDAIVKVRHSTALNDKVLGIITDSRTFGSHGDILCRVINTVDWSIVYEVGEILVPDIQGLCRIATHTERKFAAYHQIHLPRITALFQECEFVAAFIS
jgi:hypothetical protein